jgi:tetratricopeptide (TPR) repeat protein
MSDPLEPPASEPSPQAPQEAQEALQKQIWERAIEKFRIASRDNPSNVDFYIGLGQAYEGKSRDQGGKPFLRLAMEEYRKAIRTDAACQAAHDALLAAATKANLLEDIIEEYKYKQSKDPQNTLYKTYIKKIETLLFLQAGAQLPANTGGSGFVLIERMMVIAGLVCLAGSVVVYTVFRTSPWGLKGGAALIKIGVFLIVLYLGFKIVRRK